MKTTEPLPGPEASASSRGIASRLVVDSVLARLDGLDGRLQEASAELARVPALDARLRDASAELARIPTLDARLDAAAGWLGALEARTAGLERCALGLASRVSALEAEQARVRVTLSSGRELIRLLLARVRDRLLGSPRRPPEPAPFQSMLSRVKAARFADGAGVAGVMVVGSDAASTIESCRAIWPKAVFSEAAEPRMLRIASGAVPSGAEVIDASMLVIVDCTLSAGAGWTDSVREAIVLLAGRGFASVDAAVDASGDAGSPRLSVAFMRIGPQVERKEH